MNQVASEIRETKLNQAASGNQFPTFLLMRSKRCQALLHKSLKKKYKSTGFAAGWSREVIARGAEQLGAASNTSGSLPLQVPLVINVFWLLLYRWRVSIRFVLI